MSIQEPALQIKMSRKKAMNLSQDGAKLTPSGKGAMRGVLGAERAGVGLGCWLKVT
jgi:hypothetical protein